MRWILSLMLVGLLTTGAGAQMRWADDNAGMVYALLENVAESTDMAIAAADSFSYTVPAGQTFEFWRVNIRVTDGGIEMPLFGGIAALTTGLDVIVTDASNARLFRFNTGIPIKTNSDWGLLAGVDAARILEQGAGDDTLLGRWTVAKAGASMLLDAGWKFKIIKPDDLSGLTQFEMTVQGFLHNGTKANFEAAAAQGGKSGGGKLSISQ